MCEVLSISSYELGSDESYLDFYTRLLKHQVDNLLPAGSRVSNTVLEKDEVMTKSHQMLLCVLWLDKIDSRLPCLVQARYSQALKSGTNIIDLVGTLAEQVDSLLDEHSNHGRVHIDEEERKKQNNNKGETTHIKAEDVEVEGVADNGIEDFKIDFDKGLDSDFDGKKAKTVESKIKVDENVTEFEDDDWLQNHETEENIDEEKPQNEESKFTMQHFIANKSRKNDKSSCDNDFKKVRKKGSSKKKIKKEKCSTRDFQGRRTDKTLYCDMCPDFSTNYTNKYRRHMKERHKKLVKFCKECDDFLDADTKMPHSKHMKNIQCPDCDMVLNTLHLFNVHQYKVHDIGTPIQCDLCPYSTAIKAYFNAHMRTTHGEGFVCVECGERFTHKSAYKCHIKFKHEGVKEFCDQCDFVSTTRDGLSYHVKTVHLGMKAVTCKLCGIKLNRQRELRTHMATIHGSGKYWSCPKCDYNATTKQLLQEHDRKVHELIFFTCDRCPSKFVRKYALRRHMENVHKMFGIKVE